jgi:adenylate cyclase
VFATTTPSEWSAVAASRENAFCFAEYTLDLGRGCLRSGDREIDLRPKGFALLRYLVENAGRLVPREELMERLWPNIVVTDESLARCVSDVRRALNDGEQRLIKTALRRGYLFAAPVTLEVPTDRTAASPATAIRDVARASRDHEPALALPDKPSIAVLPFQNLSSDPEQEYFSDGIAEDIITLLSHSRSLFVIARNSSFAYKDRAVDVKQVARELGVRYVLEGSVRRGGNRVRVTAQLIDAETGNHLWAQRYDRDLADVFAVQDEITEAVAIAIEPTVAELERQRAVRRPLESLGAWEAYQRGLWHMARMSAAENAKGMHFFRRAIDLDPNFAAAYAQLAIATIHEATMFLKGSVEEAVNEANALAQRSVSLDPTDALGQTSLGAALALRGDYEGGLAEVGRALAINPNLAIGHAYLGAVLLYSGHPREAIDAIREALRRDPFEPSRVIRLSHIALGHYLLCDYDAAVDMAKTTIRSYPDHPWAYRHLAAALGQLGRIGEAQEALQKAIATAPKSFDMVVRHRPLWWRPEDHEHLLEGLRKAGWEG